MITKRHILSIQPGGRYNIVYTLGLADGFSTWEFPPVIMINDKIKYERGSLSSLTWYLEQAEQKRRPQFLQ